MAELRALERIGQLTTMLLVLDSSCVYSFVSIS